MWIVCGALLFAVVSFGQVYNPGKDIVDAYAKGTEMRLRQERLELQRKQWEAERTLQEEQLRQMKLRTQMLQEEADRLRSRAETRKAPEPNENASPDVDAAFAELNQLYPDLKAHIRVIADLSDRFAPATGLPIKDYLEGLYLIAKHASFVNRQSPSPSPIQEKLREAVQRESEQTKVK